MFSGVKRCCFVFSGRSIKVFRLHCVVQVRYGDRSGLLSKFQVVFMCVRMFYVVFGRLKKCFGVVSRFK